MRPPRLVVHVEYVPDMPDPAAVHAAWYAGTTSFWLDGEPFSDPRARFSFMGDVSGPLAEVIEYDVSRCSVVTRSIGGVQVTPGPFLDHLRGELAKRQVTPPAGLPFEFHLGYVGYLGYELKAETGGSPAHRSPSPDASFLFVDRLLVWDAVEGSGWLLCLSDPGRADASPEIARRWLQQTRTALADVGPPAPAPAPVVALRPEIVPFRHGKGAYLALVDACLAFIARGETYEICLTNQARVPCGESPATVYARLRASSPVPFGALLSMPSASILSASPERFLSVSSAGVAESRPIKGTRPRGNNAAEDEALRASLATSEKDRAENLMIVDLVRNDFGRVCQIGSVDVVELFAVETFPLVHQLVSTIRGQLRPDVTAVDCVEAAFPGGSMTGAPKTRTMQILDDLEGGPRGVYSGALGWFSLSGACDLSIVIRTIVLAGGVATFGTGGAILALSDPVEEYEEMLVKCRAMSATLGLALEG